MEVIAVGKLKMGGFVFGTMIGAGLGVLLAPRSGKETRNSLFAGGSDWNEQKDRLLGAVNAGKESAVGAMGRSDELRVKIDETRERLRAQMARETDDQAPVEPVE
jgi:gas vesicle protein